jgi:hypothetical protein
MASELEDRAQQTCWMGELLHTLPFKLNQHDDMGHKAKR